MQMLSPQAFRHLGNRQRAGFGRLRLGAGYEVLEFPTRHHVSQPVSRLTERWAEQAIALVHPPGTKLHTEVLPGKRARRFPTFMRGGINWV